MTTPDRRGVIVYNGEIYNYLELRAALATEGVAFASRSDTEVLLAALYHWGPARTLPRLNGQFAFAYWDARDQSVVLARDRIGEKPLYYSKQGRNFYFASELKALRAHPEYQARINDAVLPLFFRYNYVPAPQSIYEDTWKLPPAHWIRFDLRSGQSGRPMAFWSMADMVAEATANPLVDSGDALVDETEQLLRRSVEMRLVSDRPVGCFLSGGIDSSTIAALMQKASGRRIQTFTIGYGDAAMNEAEDAERVARHLGSAHTTFMVQSADVLDLVPQMADVYDEPYADASQLPTCLLSRLTARHVTVALTGDGGDEVFGGYNRYVWAREVWERLQRLPPGLRSSLAGGVAQVSPVTLDRLIGWMGAVLPRRLRMRSAGDKLHKIAYLVQARDEQDLYRRLTSLIQNPDRLCLVSGPTELPFERLTLPDATRRSEERMMLWDTQTYLPDDILVKLDRAGMRYGLEGRIPFLDNEVMRFAWRLPFEAKVGRSEGKLIIRKVLERHVPRELFERPKTGFSVPIGAWLRGPLKDWAEGLLENRALHEHVRMGPVRELWRQHLSGQRNTEYQLWSVLMLSGWLQRWQGNTRPAKIDPVELSPPEMSSLGRRGAVKGRVVFLMNSLGGAGAEKQVVLSATSLSRQGYYAEIYTLESEKFSERLDALLKEATASGVYVHKPEAGERWITSSLFACRKSLQRDHSCVLWTWGYRADLAAITFLLGLAPRISSLRSASAELMRRRAFWWRLFDYSCARYVSNTWLNVQQLAGILPGVESRCRVLYNALEQSALAQAPVALPERLDRLEVVMLGNVRVKVKGYDLAIEMMRRLRTEGRNVRLRIAGLPLEGADMEQLIRDSKLGDSCQFVGPVTAPFEFLKTAHVFLLFSRYEGMPNALLEAMSIGLPCISTRVGDVARFTRNGVHLRQIDVGDVDGAVQAVRDALEQWTDFRAMGAAGRQLIAERFSQQAFDEMLVECVDDFVTEAAPVEGAAAEA